MAPKLYGTYYSLATAKAIAVMLEKEVDFELVRVSVKDGEHRKPEYLAKQPFGLVPLLEDEDLKLFESGAIMRYIADKYEAQGTPKLYGSTKAERALVEQWMEVEVGTWGAHMQVLVRELIFTPMLQKKPTNQQTVEDTKVKLQKVMDTYEAHLTKHQYLAGDFVSIADLVHLPVSYLILNEYGMPSLLSSRPRVAAWWEAITSRPSWKEIVKNSGADWESWVKAAKSFKPQ